MHTHILLHDFWREACNLQGVWTLPWYAPRLVVLCVVKQPKHGHSAVIYPRVYGSSAVRFGCPRRLKAGAIPLLGRKSIKPCACGRPGIENMSHR